MLAGLLSLRLWDWYGIVPMTNLKPLGPPVGITICTVVLWLQCHALYHVCAFVRSMPASVIPHSVRLLCFEGHIRIRTVQYV